MRWLRFATHRINFIVFYVFDYCQNFEFFAENPEGVESASQESLGKKIFKQRLNLNIRTIRPLTRSSACGGAWRIPCTAR